jgi:trans-aconitate methyltransferase
MSRIEKTWDSLLYDDRYSFVSELGKDLLTLLSPKKGERILDLGCGTGHLTAEIAKSGAEVVGLDHSPAMIDQAKKNYPDLEFVLADAKNFSSEKPFDAVFSNAALHWMTPPEQVLTKIWDVLKPGGRLVAELGGKGNVQQIHDTLAQVVKKYGFAPTQPVAKRFFPSLGEYATLLEKQGFEVSFATFFERPTPLKEGEKGLQHWLQMFANDWLASIPPDRLNDVFLEVENLLREKLFKNGTWYADYRRLRIVAHPRS